MICVNNSHFDLDYYGGPGIMVTPTVNGSDADVSVEVFLTNACDGQELVYTLKDAAGNVVADIQTTGAGVVLVALIFFLFPRTSRGIFSLYFMKGKTSTNFPIAKERRGAMDYEAQYDKIYRYCYFKLHNQTVAEDVTQETFLRFLGSDTYKERGRELNYLYTIARNLCIDESRKRVTEELTEEITKEGPEERIIESMVMKQAMEKLTPEERELVLLRFVNEVPVKVICELQECSRFALNRRIKQVLKKLREYLSEETIQKVEKVERKHAGEEKVYET
jgi:RNA polymerase sigma-70 factor (ECF subfamily)